MQSPFDSPLSGFRSPFGYGRRISTNDTTPENAVVNRDGATVINRDGATIVADPSERTS